MIIVGNRPQQYAYMLISSIKYCNKLSVSTPVPLYNSLILTVNSLYLYVWSLHQYHHNLHLFYQMNSRMVPQSYVP